MGWKSSPRTLPRRFRTHFGMDPVDCYGIWEMFEDIGWKKYAGRNPKKKHMLWDLFFLKRYNTLGVYAYTMHVDEKTFSRCYWFYVEGISSLVRKMVFILYMFIVVYFFYRCLYKYIVCIFCFITKIQWNNRLVGDKKC